MKGLTALENIIKEKNPDILCFQEFELDNVHFSRLEKLGYKMADYSYSFWKFLKIYGVVTFYKADTFFLKESESFDLSRSLYESILNIIRINKNNPRTILKTEFIHKKNKKKVEIYNLHLAPWATGGHRAKQVEKALQNISNSMNPIIVLGDFNHPFQRKYIENLKQENNFKEATSSFRYTFITKFLRFFPIRFKLDYVLYKNTVLSNCERISFTSSDHFPIFTTFSL